MQSTKSTSPPPMVSMLNICPFFFFSCPLPLYSFPPPQVGGWGVWKRRWANTLPMHANAKLNLSQVTAGFPLSPRKVCERGCCSMDCAKATVAAAKGKRNGFAKEPLWVQRVRMLFFSQRKCWSHEPVIHFEVSLQLHALQEFPFFSRAEVAKKTGPEEMLGLRTFCQSPRHPPCQSWWSWNGDKLQGPGSRHRFFWEGGYAWGPSWSSTIESMICGLSWETTLEEMRFWHPKPAPQSPGKVNELVHCQHCLDPLLCPSRLALIAPKSLKSLSTQKKHVFLGMAWQNAFGKMDGLSFEARIF